MRTEQLLFEIEPAVEARYMWVQRRLFELRYSANLLTGEASTVVGSEARVARWKGEIEALKQEMLVFQEKYPKLIAHLEKYWLPRPPRPPESAASVPRKPAPLTSAEPGLGLAFWTAAGADAK